ncbi:DNA-processing protein DprA [Leptospira borgpetersenii]|uniref:DNA protecting protein DprA n=1 Tax=Leptospira borgpetersenii str. Brem 328 TaxID=1049780 RepID=A0ABC9SDV0_LEPBO|nr:DNA-processing protein DprA [Leptospira borgpetersenii]EMN13940.1 DNA protecting protein DprA [Leptospira borgpetersenii str. Brem 307]EMN15948.1 DNA protecting protein DprA [Leptospira borgpetersenii str. Brem 328]
MNPLILVDSYVSKFCSKNGIFKKLNSLANLNAYLERFLPSSVLRGALYASEKISSDLKKTGFSVLSFFDPEYPSLLKEIYDPPLILFYKGNLNILDLSFAAVVGTRNPSPISYYAAELIPYYLKGTGFSGVVSGFAKGIDATSMNAALDEELAVIGVMGTGPETEYPFENRKLYQRMKYAKRTLILTEYPPGQKILKYTFPKRNRIVTGMCNSVFIMEAPEKSGAISSAHNALEQNRNIFIFSDPRQTKNQGGEILIRDGAESLDLNTISFGMKEVFHMNHLLPDSQSKIPGMLAELSEKRFSGEWKSIGSGYYAKKTFFQPILPGL